MMRDARRGQFDVVLVWASDRIARLVKHFLEVLDELSRFNIESIRFREQIDTGDPLGRAVVIVVGAVKELERSLIVERVRAGMRRPSAKAGTLDGKHWFSIGPPSCATGKTVRAWASWQRAILSPAPPCADQTEKPRLSLQTLNAKPGNLIWAKSIDARC